MVKVKAEERASIEDIKRSIWYKGSIYTKDEVKKIMKKYVCWKEIGFSAKWVDQKNFVCKFFWEKRV